jgi:hypothetical protein
VLNIRLWKNVGIGATIERRKSFGKSLRLPFALAPLGGLTFLLTGGFQALL